MIDFALSLPVLVKVFGSLAVILILNRFLKNLLISATAGTVILGLWTGHFGGEFVDIAWKRFSSPDNLLLMTVVLLVIWLSSQMTRSGVMQDLVRVVQARIPRRLAIAVLPAVIGFLPMPGGAIFSAPLVDSCDREKRLSGLLKTQTNYWFRHVWEYWWPLYPGVLLTTALTGLEIWQFILLQIPVSMLAIASGYWFLLRRVPREGNSGETAVRETGQSFWALIAPILVVIGSYLLIRIFLPVVAEINKYLPMMIGVLAAMIFLQARRKIDGAGWKTILLSKRAFLLAVLIAVIRIYAAFIEAPLPSGILLVEQMRLELSRFGIPLLAVMALVPFLSGVAMGLTVGVVGASLPIVLSLIGRDPSLGKLLSVTVLAYGCGFMGQMFSPVHVCILVTTDYFKTRVFRSLVSLLRPAGVVLLGIIILSLGIERLWPG